MLTTLLTSDKDHESCSKHQWQMTVLLKFEIIESTGFNSCSRVVWVREGHWIQGILPSSLHNKGRALGWNLPLKMAANNITFNWSLYNLDTMFFGIAFYVCQSLSHRSIHWYLYFFTDYWNIYCFAFLFKVWYISSFLSGSISLHLLWLLSWFSKTPSL